MNLVLGGITCISLLSVLRLSLVFRRVEVINLRGFAIVLLSGELTGVLLFLTDSRIDLFQFSAAFCFVLAGSIWVYGIALRSVSILFLRWLAKEYPRGSSVAELDSVVLLPQYLARVSNLISRGQLTVGANHELIVTARGEKAVKRVLALRGCLGADGTGRYFGDETRAPSD